VKRSAIVYQLNKRAGRLEETADGYTFTYDQAYLLDPGAPPVSLLLPKRLEPYVSKALFPFFYGLLAEGALKSEQCRRLKLDEHDHFGRLIKTAGETAIGSVSVIEEKAS
jgi:HipA-like protein